MVVEPFCLALGSLICVAQRFWYPLAAFVPGGAPDIDPVHFPLLDSILCASLRTLPHYSLPACILGQPVAKARYQVDLVKSMESYRADKLSLGANSIVEAITLQKA